MPTIIRAQGFAVRVFGPPREHAPPHVHVTMGKEGLVVIRLPAAASPPVIWRVYHMKSRDVVRAFRLIEANAPLLLDAWRRIHG